MSLTVQAHAKSVHPRAPVFLCLPAMGTPASFYQPLAVKLAHAVGGSAVVADLRGQGEHPDRAARGANFGYREIVADICSLIDELTVQFPARPLVLLGHSLGGQLSVLAAPRIARRVAGIVLVAAGTAHWRAWPRSHRLRAFLIVHAIRIVAALLPWYPGRRLGFGGDQPRRLMRDWSRCATTGRYELQKSAIDYEAAAFATRITVLALRVRADPIAPRGAVEELLARLASASIVRRTVQGVRAHSPWRRHFSWARQPDEVVAAVAGWWKELSVRQRVTAKYRSAA